MAMQVRYDVPAGEQLRWWDLLGILLFMVALIGLPMIAR